MHKFHATTVIAVRRDGKVVPIGQRGLIPENRRRLICLGMFWHLLDVVWIGVFTFVYLLGALS